MKASPVSNNPRGVLHWTFFMLPWKNYSMKLQRWPLLELKDFTFSYPRMAFSVKHQSASKNNFSKNDTTQSLQNLKAYCGRKTLVVWSALWNWRYYETVMACLFRQRERRELLLRKTLLTKQWRQMPMGITLTCHVQQSLFLQITWQWHQRGSFRWPHTGVKSLHQQVLFHRCGDATVFSSLARHFWDQNSHEPQLCSLLIPVFLFHSSDKRKKRFEMFLL